MMAVELPTAQEDVDALWTASKNSLHHKPQEEKEHRDATTKQVKLRFLIFRSLLNYDILQADHDRNSRTNVVLAWVGTNM